MCSTFFIYLLSWDYSNIGSSSISRSNTKDKDKRGSVGLTENIDQSVKSAPQPNVRITGIFPKFDLTNWNNWVNTTKLKVALCRACWYFFKLLIIEVLFRSKLFFHSFCIIIYTCSKISKDLYVTISSKVDFCSKLRISETELIERIEAIKLIQPIELIELTWVINLGKSLLYEAFLLSKWQNLALHFVLTIKIYLDYKNISDTVLLLLILFTNQCIEKAWSFVISEPANICLWMTPKTQQKSLLHLDTY